MINVTKKVIPKRPCTDMTKYARMYGKFLPPTAPKPKPVYMLQRNTLLASPDAHPIWIFFHMDFIKSYKLGNENHVFVTETNGHDISVMDKKHKTHMMESITDKSGTYGFTPGFTWSNSYRKAFNPIVNKSAVDGYSYSRKGVTYLISNDGLTVQSLNEKGDVHVLAKTETGFIVFTGVVIYNPTTGLPYVELEGFKISKDNKYLSKLFSSEFSSVALSKSHQKLLKTRDVDGTMIQEHEGTSIDVGSYKYYIMEDVLHQVVQSGEEYERTELYNV